MPALPAPGADRRGRAHGPADGPARRRSRALRTAVAATATVVTTALIGSCGAERSDSDRIAEKAAAAADTASAPPSPTALPDPTRAPAPPAQLLPGAARTVRPSLAPENGETVGVGQPVSLVFKGQRVDPALRAGIEGRMRITTSTAVVGAWHWAEAKGDTYLHFRPRQYWPAGTKVSLKAPLQGVRLDARTAAAGDRTLDFTVGASMVNKVDLAAHTLTVVKDGTPVRTIPVSGGEAKYRTREGVKTILSKDGTVLMDSRTIGIPRDHPDGFYGRYEWSMRETISGEYVHAAPDNAESFGRANVSHGCIGMSTADAKWLYGQSRKGDVVEVTGTTGKPMDRFGNGYGDWNLDWDAWVKGSALGAFKTT
ncbi:L,D-transpeptidase [Streptomyces sp. NPDC059917]|uniref:L,D-transpeptidase n=1 Tax=Streptomyces sp. NPDC059917 TaxID=3347002 RepID=UPI00365F2248